MPILAHYLFIRGIKTSGSKLASKLKSKKICMCGKDKRRQRGGDASMPLTEFSRQMETLRANTKVNLSNLSSNNPSSMLKRLLCSVPVFAWRRTGTARPDACLSTMKIRTLGSCSVSPRRKSSRYGIVFWTRVKTGRTKSKNRIRAALVRDWSVKTQIRNHQRTWAAMTVNKF